MDAFERQRKINTAAQYAVTAYAIWFFRKPIKMFLILVVAMSLFDACVYVPITGERLFGSPSPTTQKEAALLKKEAEKKNNQRHQQWSMKRIVKLQAKGQLGDLNAQAELAEYFFLDDEHPSYNKKRGMKLLVEAAEEDCAKAQNWLGNRYWREGNKFEAERYWVLAARSREDRKYGTGSYFARDSLKHHFPEMYDSRWGND